MHLSAHRSATRHGNAALAPIAPETRAPKGAETLAPKAAATLAPNAAAALMTKAAAPWAPKAAAALVPRAAALLIGLLPTLALHPAAAAAASLQLRAPTASQGQAAGRIEGVVRSAESGDALAGVSVTVEGTAVAVSTDVRGRFAIDGLPSGVRVVRFEQVGRRPAADTVTVAAGAVVRVEAALGVSPVPLATLEVLLDRTRMVGGRGALRGVPGSAHYLSDRDLRSLASPFADVHALLRPVPGVTVQEEDGYGLRPNIGMRGTGVERSSRIAVMEDGVPAAPAPYAAPSAYYFPLSARMEAIEVRKGSSQVKYGPWTTGGALNLVSRSIPGGRVLAADVAGGQRGTQRLRLTAGDAWSNVGWLVETNRIATDGFKRLDGGGETGFDVRDVVGKVRVNTSASARIHQELELKAGWTDERSDETYLGLTSSDFDRAPLRRYAGSQRDVMNADHRQLVARHFAAAGAFDLTTTAYRNDFARNWYKLDKVAGVGIANVLDVPAAHDAALEILRGADAGADALTLRANNRSYVSEGVQTSLGIESSLLGVAHSLELGVRFHRDSEDRFQHEDGYRMVAGAMELTSRGTPGSQSNRVSEARAWAFFLEDRIALGAWTLTPGVRHERIRFTRRDYAAGDAQRAAPTRERDNGVDVWVPGVGVTFAPAPSLTLFGGVHRGFGPPGPGADAGARAEESVNYEAGARWVGGTAHAEAVAFYNDYDNILGRATLATGESGAGDLFNGGRVEVRGLELSGEVDLAPRTPVRVPLRVAYTWTDARFRSAFQSEYDAWGSVEPGDRLPYLPGHQLFAALRVEAARWNAGITATASGAMRTVAGHGPIVDGEGTDPFTVLGLNGEYAVGRAVRLHGAVQNLTDARYIVARRPAGARPGLPRTALLGVRVSAF